MGGVRAERAQRTREQVLAAARGLFAERGYHATGTTDIVEAAGAGTRGALYHHFADKQALFRAVFEQVELDRFEKTGAAVAGDTGLEILVAGLGAFLDASIEGEIRQILLIDGPAVLGWEAWREIEERFGLGAIRSMLTQGRADGSIRDIDIGTPVQGIAPTNSTVPRSSTPRSSL